MKKNNKGNTKKIFLHALKAVSPEAAVKAHLSVTAAGVMKAGKARYDLSRFANVYILAMGKAAPAMVRGVESVLGPRVTGGVAVTKYGHGKAGKKVDVIEASHPIPDGAGLSGAKKLLDLARSADKDDLVICLISGGASALAPAPVEGVTLRDKQRLTKLLVNSGAEIGEINAVRKHLSRIKGGALAKVLAPATVLSLIISDVVGDDISAIASGPTVPDPTTYGDCIEILKRYRLAKRVPTPILYHLERGAAGKLGETPGTGDFVFRKVKNHIIASNAMALSAAQQKARELGYKPIVLTSSLTGNSREAAGFLASIIMEMKSSSSPVRPPACVLMGGETTLPVVGKGRGGRNQEFCLVMATALAGVEGVAVLAADTDGIDGPTEAAGAVVDGKTVKRALAKGMDAAAFLEDNDSNAFFKPLGDLVVTGPTGTNVMDMVVAVVDKDGDKAVDKVRE